MSSFFFELIAAAVLASSTLQGLDTLLLKQCYAALVSLLVHFTKIDADATQIKYALLPLPNLTLPLS